MFRTKIELAEMLRLSEAECAVLRDEARLLKQHIEKITGLNDSLIEAREKLHLCKEGPWCEKCSYSRIVVDTNADKTVRYCKHDACKNFDQKQ